MISKKIIIGVVAAILLVGIYFLNPGFYSSTKTNFCTMDAKHCPDGSYVGRTGPKCEFEACPKTPVLPSGYTLENYKVEKITGESCWVHSDCQIPGEYAIQSRCPFTSLCLENKCVVVCPEYDGWKTYNDESKGISFKYPEKLTTKYTSVVDWPPQVKFLNQTYTCNWVGSEIEQAGRTEKRIVDNREYCVTKKNEGAAGSTYTNYIYAFSQNNGTATLTFSIRSVQCGNYYGMLEETECEGEQQTFDIDGVVDRIFKTLEIKK